MANVFRFTNDLINSVGEERAIEIICSLNDDEIKSLYHYGE